MNRPRSVRIERLVIRYPGLAPAGAQEYARGLARTLALGRLGSGSHGTIERLVVHAPPGAKPAEVASTVREQVSDAAIGRSR
jgi:hypothetical protein